MNNTDIIINKIKYYKFNIKEPHNINFYIIPNMKESLVNYRFEKCSNYIKNSWFPEDICKNILPSFKILFKKDIKKQELQCSISIIIPQFEKIIRVLCQKNNIPTTNKGREEKTIGKLLQNEDFKKILSENDLKYIKSVLLKDGLDLRDKFAHGFDQEIYDEKILEILFITIIILTKFNE